MSGFHLTKRLLAFIIDFAFIYWDVAKPVRHRTLTPAFRWFESSHPSHLYHFAHWTIFLRNCRDVGFDESEGT